jgi:hypothetical protein
MKSFEENAHAFIVRLWQEPREIEGAVVEWRGVVLHVATNRRQYFKHLDDIISFIAPYAGKRNAHISGTRKLKKWFKLRLPFLRRT